MKKLTITLVISLLVSTLLASFAAAETKITFTDVKDHWAESTVYKMVEQKIVNGFPDGSFRPDNQVTRAQFIKMVIEATGLSKDDQQGNEQWYETYVRAAFNGGLHREADFKDNWNQNLTRMEMVRLAVRATDTKIRSDNSFVSDTTFMVKATNSGLIHGMADSGLNLNGLSTRAQSVTVINRVLDLISGKTLPTDARAISKAKAKYDKVHSHPAFINGGMLDIDNVDIIDDYYEKKQHGTSVGAYKNVEQFRENVTGAIELSNKIKVVIDKKNEKFIITIPNFDDDNYSFTLTTINDQFSKSGTYSVDFKNTASNGAIYSLSISDYEIAGNVLYSQFGYIKNGEYLYGDGTITHEIIFGE